MSLIIDTARFLSFIQAFLKWLLSVQNQEELTTVLRSKPRRTNMADKDRLVY